jgi:hypothetical protein
MGRIHLCFLYCLLVTIRELVGSFIYIGSMLYCWWGTMLYVPTGLGPILYHLVYIGPILYTNGGLCCMPQQVLCQSCITGKKKWWQMCGIFRKGILEEFVLRTKERHRPEVIQVGWRDSTVAIVPTTPSHARKRKVRREATGGKYSDLLVVYCICLGKASQFGPQTLSREDGSRNSTRPFLSCLYLYHMYIYYLSLSLLIH